MYNLKKNVGSLEDLITPVVSMGADGAIPLRRLTTVLLTKSTAGAFTLAAPPAHLNGSRMLVLSTTAAAHTVTQSSPGLDGAGSSGDVATFGGAAGDCMELIAFDGTWYVVSLKNVTVA